MISVQGLTKRYGQTEAIRNISFSVDKGEVVGFLGPNGAGKSTTMKILCGYLPADAGEVRVAGFDVFGDSVKARSRIGYMPENVPLYPEMRVSEYLSYRAALKGVSARQTAEKVEDALQLCGLSGVRRKLIGTLSKGYRQRVGLADALINEPDILILDEPTIGLDPGQIREVRELIKGLAARHTILLSSHILSEVEMTCSRVLILDKGRIVASGTPSDLRERAGLPLAGSIRIELKAPASEALAILRPAIGDGSVQIVGTDNGWTELEIVSGEQDPREDLFRAVVANGWTLRELSSHRSSLEEIFASFVKSGEQAQGEEKR
ncbi:MAG: ABC transporter ATP-binding protein [Proteobacteria bacterium]|nr:ABC transporter ATP-binding protein [Pseudomonadota bacterium]